MPSKKDLFRNGFIFQYDNHLKHTDNAIKTYVDRKKTKQRKTSSHVLSLTLLKQWTLEHHAAKIQIRALNVLQEQNYVWRIFTERTKKPD